MPSKAVKPFVLTDALLAAFDTNERINQYLIENLPAEAWRAEPPAGKGRDIASIVAHMHNVRLMWLKAAGGKPSPERDSKIPEQLDRARLTAAQARKGLTESHAALRAVLEASLSADGRIKGFKPDAAGFVGYLIAHDAHHRGQITMLARQSGHPVSQKTMFGLWEWGSRGSAA
ncbi:MAG TPA: DinB family protein [Terriglobales bacterium]|nr:DinB family protein [Terriglobales bacterium]